MINLIIDWKPVEFTFMGEKITAEVRPLTRDQMLMVVPFLGGESEAGSVDSGIHSLKLQKAAAPVIPEVVRNIKGVQVNGKDVPLDMIGVEAALCNLAVNLISHAIMASSVDRDSEKNLQSPSGANSPGQIVDK